MNLSRRAFLSGTITAALALLTACGQTASQGAVQGSKPPSSGAAGSIAGSSTSSDWNSLMAAAKQEGTVVLGLGPGSGPVTRQVLAPAIDKQFGVKVDLLVGPSQEITSRLQLEQGSGQKHSIDLVMSGANSLYSGMYDGHLLQPLKPHLILPEVLNPSNWQIGRPWFMDPEQQYVLRLITTVSGFVTVNTDYIKPDELRSWKDLLKPRYIGKICSFDPSVNGNGAQEAVALALKLGDDFVKQLYIGQKVTMSTDNQQIADWVGHGKYPIGLALDADFVERLKKDGLPVAVTPHFPDMPGYVTAGAGLLALVKDAPHPNAAALFANWIASKDGNELFAKGVAYASPLTTVKSDWAPDYTLPKKGEDYIDTYDWTYALQTYPSRYKQLQQMLKA